MAMEATYTYWQDPKDGMWLGYWNAYPDYQTEGHTLDELKYMLQDILGAIRDGVLVDTHEGHREGKMAFA